MTWKKKTSDNFAAKTSIWAWTGIINADDYRAVMMFLVVSDAASSVSLPKRFKNIILSELTSLDRTY